MGTAVRCICKAIYVPSLASTKFGALFMWLFYPCHFVPV